MNKRYDPITGKVVPVFFHYALPSVLGMLAVTSAGIIDGIFIGNFVGSTALAAVNIAQPTWAIFAAVVFMLAVGGSVMCGKFLGENRPQAANNIFTKTMIASVGLGVLISGICLLFLDDVVGLLGANEDLHDLVFSYMRIILWFAPILIAALTLDYFVRVDGRPVLASVALFSFAIINIGLNWLLIVVLGWGIEGAAWASAIAEMSILLILMTHLFSPKCSLRLVAVKHGWSDVLKAAYNGFSEFANELSIGLIVLLFNWVMISRLGVAGVAAYTIIGYLVMIGLEVSYGIAESLQPTVSKNLGARQPERITQFMLVAVLSNFVVGLIVLLFNWVMISRLGVAGVAAYTIIGYLVMIGLEVSYGIAESLQPTVSKNLGARQPERITQFMRVAVLSNFVVGLMVSTLFVLAPVLLISMFLGDKELETVEIALEFIALFWPAFLFNGMNITFASYFTAMHKPLQSAAIAVSRSLLFPGLGLLILPLWFGDRGVYLTIPISEALAFVLALVLVSRYRPASITKLLDEKA